MLIHLTLQRWICDFCVKAPAKGLDLKAALRVQQAKKGHHVDRVVHVLSMVGSEDFLFLHNLPHFVRFHMSSTRFNSRPSKQSFPSISPPLHLFLQHLPQLISFFVSHSLPLADLFLFRRIRILSPLSKCQGRFARTPIQKSLASFARLLSRQLLAG